MEIQKQNINLDDLFKTDIDTCYQRYPYLNNDELQILFETKLPWFEKNTHNLKNEYINDKNKFYSILKKILLKQKNEKLHILEGIQFPCFNLKELKFYHKLIDFKYTFFYGKATFESKNKELDFDLLGVNFYHYVTFHSVTFPSKFTRFARAHFHNEVSFFNAKFKDKITFSHARFYQDCNFSNVKFKSFADFHSSIFHSSTNFSFSNFRDEAQFGDSVFKKSTDFSYSTFKATCDFNKSTFHNDILFTNCHFHDETIFRSVTVKGISCFSEIYFDEDTYFTESIFKDKISFINSTSEKTFDFSDVTFNSLLLDKLDLKKASYLGLRGWDHSKLKKVKVSARYFQTKETARIIKAHFESQNNITESNKYFQIEQQLYLDELKNKESIEPTKHITKFVLYLNKFVSNFGTDWIRPLFVMFSFGFLASFFYILCSNTSTLFIFEKHPIPNKDILFWTAGGFAVSTIMYLTYYYKRWGLLTLTILGYIMLMIFSQDLRLITNDISKLINPLNIFKGKDYFEDIAPYGMMVKLIMATLIYQFIMAFRQNTRRK